MQTKAELLSQLETVPYLARIQKMIALGRSAKEEQSTASLIALLWQGDAYERLLALYSCHGSSDGGRVLAAVSDPSRLIRGLSFSMIAPLCNDEQALAALEIAYTRRRHLPVLRMLRKRLRFSVIDTFLEKLRAQRDPRFAEYSIFASTEKFSSWVDSLSAQPSQLFWQRALQRYPEEVLKHLLKQIQSSADGLQTKTKLLLAQSLPVLQDRLPEETLSLLEALIVAGAPDWKPPLKALFPKMPVKVFAILQRYKLNLKDFSFYGVIHQLEKSQLLFLLKEHRTLLSEPYSWFSHFSADTRAEKIKEWFDDNPEVLQVWQEGFPKEPQWGIWFFQYLPDSPETLEDRIRLYELWSIAVRNNKGIVSQHMFHVLPRYFQEREARRHLTEVKDLETRPLERLQYCHFLPWQEAHEHLAPWLHHPEVQTRAPILSLYLRLLANQRDFDVEEALAAVTKRKFEADPVRNAMLSALASWSPHHWRPEHAATLSQIMQDALDASDLSPSSVSSMASLARVFISVDPRSAFDWMIQLDKVRRGVDATNFGWGKSEDEIKQLAPHCMRFAERLVPGREQLLHALLSSMSTHVHHLPQVDALVKKVDVKKLHLSLQISWLAYLNLYFPEQLAVVLPEVLRHALPNHKQQILLSLLQQSTPAALEGALLTSVTAHLSQQREIPALIELLLPLYQKMPQQTRELTRALSRSIPQPTWEAIVSALLARTDFFHAGEMYALSFALLEKTESHALANELVQLLLTHHKDQFRRALPALLASDPSYGVLPNLLSFLSWSMQHLLGPYVSGQVIRGKFAPKEEWVPRVDKRSLYRWSRAAHEQLSRTLDQKIEEVERLVPSVLSLLALRVELSYTSHDLILRMIHDPRPPIKEKSIRLLSRLDAGQGVAALLECLGDERARFAVYGLRRTALELPPPLAVDLLKKTPTHKVTVAKELFRLLGDIRAEESYQLLIALYSPALHRDARIAHLRALWEHLEREETWEVFARALQDPDWFVAVRLSEMPTERLTAFSEKKLAESCAALLSRPEPEARIALLHRVAVLPIEDKERLLFKGCLSRLDSTYLDECSAAANAVLSRAQGRDTEPLIARIKEILPMRRQLSILLERLMVSLKNKSREQHKIAHGVLLFLLQDELLTVQAVRLLSALDSLQLLSDTVRQLSSQGRLHVDVLSSLYQTIQHLSTADAELLELAFTPEPDPLLRRLALESLLQAAKSGWTKLRLRRLSLFQRDPSPIVASAAQFIFAKEA